MADPPLGEGPMIELFSEQVVADDGSVADVKHPDREDLQFAIKPAPGQASFTWTDEDEKKHPRDEGGKFASKPGQKAGPKKPNGKGTSSQPGESRFPGSHRHETDFGKLVRVAKSRADMILKNIRRKGPADWQVDTVRVDSLTPSQEGEDILNESSRYLSKHIGTYNTSGRDPSEDDDSLGMNLDYAPVAVDSEGRIIDGNHRWQARKLAGLEYIDVIRPKETWISESPPKKPRRAKKPEQFADPGHRTRLRVRGGVSDPG